MDGLVRICSQADLPSEGEACEVIFHRRQFCVARSGGAISVMDNLCPHKDGPLGQGFVENGRVVCPWHAWAFDVNTGEAEHSAKVKVQVYEALIQDGGLMVRLPEF
jgi:nitrite reductase (NADH) small subunit